MTGPRWLVIFLRAPQWGAAKTRLARGIGAFETWRFQREQIARLGRTLARDPRWRAVLAVTPDRFAREGRFFPRGVPRIPQGPGDLGRRMARALLALPAGPRLLVGADIPGLEPRHIARAFAALRANEAVFGPARDGGYWLVGVRSARLLPRLFEDVAWGGPRALEETLRNLPTGARYALLETLSDVDDAADYARWRAGRT